VKNILSFSDYDPADEYKAELRRDLNLNVIRRSPEYKELIRMGFEEETSDQQELNNTLKFIRTRRAERDRGHDFPFYTIHPSGTVRRYNPPKSKEFPEGSGNDIKVFKKPFVKGRDYIKGLKYLIGYLKRKESKGDFK
jgi:hypothetical protein